MKKDHQMTKNYRSKKRTEAQNNALHLYFQMIADALNNEGLDVRVVLQVIAEKGVDMMWAKELVKELLWRRIQKKYLNKQSTTELDSTGEITQIYDMLNKFLSQEFFISQEFPSLESLENGNNKNHDNKNVRIARP